MSNIEVERSDPAVAETMEKRAQKLKGLQVIIVATAGVPEAIDLARSRFIQAYGRAPLHDDLAYACMLIDAYGRAPAAPVPKGFKLVPIEPYAGANYEAGLWSRRNWDAAMEDQAAAPQPPDAFQTADDFELWWADHMPNATQSDAWNAWVTLHYYTKSQD